MAVELATAYVSIVPTTKGLKARLDKEMGGPVEASAKASGEKAGKAFGAGFSKSKALATGAIAAAGAAVLKSASSFSGAAKEVSRLQRLTGGSAEEMSHLRFAAQQSGVTVDKLAVSLGLFSRNIQAGKVEKLGIEVRDANGHLLPMSEIMGRVADKFESMPNGAEKTALAMQLFGRSGAMLLPLLNKGSAGFDDLAKKADRLGVTLNDKQLQAMKDNVAATRDFQASMQGLQISLGQNVLPLMTDLAKASATGAQGLNHVPAPAKEGAVALAGLGGAALFMAPKVVSGVSALRQISSSAAAFAENGGRAAKAGVAIGQSVGWVAALAAAAKVIYDLSIQYQITAVDTDAAGTALKVAAEKGTDGLTRSAGALKAAGADVDSLGDAFVRSDRSIKQTMQDGFEFGQFWGSEGKAARTEIDKWDKDLAAMVKTDGADKARAAYKALMDQIGRDPSSNLHRFNDFKAALAGAGVSARELGKDGPSAIDGTGAAAEANAPKVMTLAEKWQSVHDSIQSARDLTLSQFDAKTELPGAFQDLLNAQGKLKTAQQNANDGKGNWLVDHQALVDAEAALTKAAQRVADLQVTAAGKTKDSSAANALYIKSLFKVAAALDPASPVRKNLQGLIIDLQSAENLGKRNAAAFGLTLPAGSTTPTGSRPGGAGAGPDGLGPRGTRSIHNVFKTDADAGAISREQGRQLHRTGGR